MKPLRCLLHSGTSNDHRALDFFFIYIYKYSTGPIVCTSSRCFIFPDCSVYEDKLLNIQKLCLIALNIEFLYSLYTHFTIVENNIYVMITATYLQYCRAFNPSLKKNIYCCDFRAVTSLNTSLGIINCYSEYTYC